MMRFCSLLLAILLLSACAATPNKYVADYDKNVGAVYPPVSFFISPPSNQLMEECREFDNASVMQHCHINQFDSALYWQQLHSSGLFEKVSFGGKEADYQIVISTANMSRETAADITKAALAGATLLLVPVDNEFPVQADVAVLWRNILIKRFDYKVPFSQTMSLFHKPEDATRNFAETLVSYFLRDIEQEQVFSGAFLLSALNDSDYIHDLKAPAQLLDFNLIGQYVFPNPLFGTQLRYTNPQFQDDYLDVFVYPIRRTDWQDTQDVIQHELDNSREETELFYQEQQRPLVLGNNRDIRWQQEGSEFYGGYFEGYVDDLEPLPTSTYVFVQGDKFIKLRCSFPAEYAEQLVKALLPALTVPDESLFMTQLRQHHRTEDN